MIRKPQQSPNTQIGWRFNALYATVRPGAQPTPVDLNPALHLKGTAMRFSAKGLDAVILQSLLYVSDQVTLGPTADAFISQLRLVSAYAEVTPYLTIRFFLNEGLSHASMLPGVGAEIRTFNKVEQELHEQHGDGMFPFLKCLQLNGYECLAPVKISKPLQGR